MYIGEDAFFECTHTGRLKRYLKTLIGKDTYR